MAADPEKQAIEADLKTNVEVMEAQQATPFYVVQTPYQGVPVQGSSIQHPSAVPMQTLPTGVTYTTGQSYTQTASNINKREKAVRKLKGHKCGAFCLCCCCCLIFLGIIAAIATAIVLNCGHQISGEEFHNWNLTLSNQTVEHFNILSTNGGVVFEVDDTRNDIGIHLKKHAKPEEIDYITGDLSYEASTMTLTYEMERSTHSWKQVMCEEIEIIVKVPTSYSGALKLKTSNAAVNLRASNFSSLVIDTTNGYVGLKGPIHSNKIEVDTNNGYVSAYGLVADSISFRTTNGRISMDDITANSIQAQTTNGMIDDKVRFGEDCEDDDDDEGEHGDDDDEGEEEEEEDEDRKRDHGEKEKAEKKGITLVGKDSKFYAKTTNGALKFGSLTTFNGSTMNFKTSNGRVEVQEIVHAKDSQYSITSTNAKVEMTFKAFEGLFDVTTSNGDIEIDSAPKFWYTTNTDRKKKGYVDNADSKATIRTETTNGKVELSFRNPESQ